MIHTTLLFMSGGDIAIILAVALLLFGGKKLPELARGLGTGIKEFKDATSGVINPVTAASKTTVTEPVAPVAVNETHA